MRMQEHALGYLLRDSREPGAPGITLVGPTVSKYFGIDHRCCAWDTHESRIYNDGNLVENPGHGFLLRDLERALQLAKDCEPHTGVIAVTLIGELERDIKVNEYVSVELGAARPNGPSRDWNLLGYDIARLSFESVLCCIGGYEVHSDNGALNLSNGLFYEEEYATSLCKAFNLESGIVEPDREPNSALWVCGIYQIKP